MILNIANIITYLATKPTVVSALWNRIFLWEPEIEQTENYLTINIISEQIVETDQRSSRLEFRYIWKNKTISFQTLANIEKIVYDYITIRENMNGFIPYKVYSEDLVNTYDQKQRKVLIRDIIFYYVNW